VGEDGSDMRLEPLMPDLRTLNAFISSAGPRLLFLAVRGAVGRCSLLPAPVPARVVPYRTHSITVDQ
jgi:hypothetical protein